MHRDPQIKPMIEFAESTPTLPNYWRSIVLFGSNVASYKFALSKALLEIKDQSNDLVKLEYLALPFAKHVCEHLSHSEKQSTSPSSKFLDACRDFNRALAEGNANEESLRQTATNLGFQNVIDAFHVVNGADIPQRFFIDERSTNGGIRLTDNFYRIHEQNQADCLAKETEARWRLVETAWGLRMASNLLQVHYDESEELLFTSSNSRRINITSSRDALNGYQKGKCFYTFNDISILSGAANCAEVDHFFPHVLKTRDPSFPNVDGVWNLVLATKDANAGTGGKFAKCPSINLLERLHRRNEYLIGSNHPLRETLMRQTGVSTPARRTFLQDCYNRARQNLIHTWEPVSTGDALF